MRFPHKVFLYNLLILHLILFSPAKANFPNSYEIQDLEKTGSDFQLEASSWTITNFGGSSTCYNCDGVDLLGGYQISGKNNILERTYASVAAHDSIFYCFSFFIIDSWDPTDGIELYFDGNLVEKWANVDHTDDTSSYALTCGNTDYSDLGQVDVCGRFFLPGGTTTSLFVQVKGDFDEDTTNESFGVRNFFIHLATKQPGQTEGLCLSTTVVSPDIKMTCTCPDGKYDSGSGCQQCDPACSTCFGPSASDCYKCSATTFFNGIICAPCHSLCVTCFGALQTTCYTCTSDAFLSGTTCVSCNDVCSGCYGPLPSDCVTCAAGTYKDYPSNECRVCNSLCSACYGPDSTDCTACNVGAFLLGNECVPCHAYCSDCFGPKNNTCNACKPGYYFYIGHWCLDACDPPLQIANPPDVPSLQCLYQCPTNQYMDSSGTCHPTCDLPKNPTVKLERNYCEYGCEDGSGGLTYSGQYIFPDGECKSGCPTPFTTSVVDGYNMCNAPKCGDSTCQTCTSQSECPGGSYCDAFAGGLCLPNSAQLRTEIDGTITNGYIVQAAVFPLNTPAVDPEIDDVLAVSIESLDEGTDYKTTIKKLYTGIFQVNIEFLRATNLNPIKANFLYSPARLMLTAMQPLPKIIYLSAEFIALAQKADIGSNTTFIALVLCSVGFALLGKLSTGWSFLAMNQYLHYLLFLNLYFLEHIKIYLRSLKNYSMILLNSNDNSDTYLKSALGIALPQRFKEEEYPLNYFINTGQIFGMIIGALFVLALVSFLRDCCGIRHKSLISLRSQLRWNGILRQILTYSLPLLVACFVEIYSLLFGKRPSIDVLIISFATILFTFGIIGKMLYLISSIPVIKYAAKVEYFGYYRTLWDGLHTGTLARYYYWALAIRGLLLAYVIVFFDLYPYAQICILIVYQCGIIIFFVRGISVQKVYNDTAVNRVSLIAEIGLLVMKLAMWAYYFAYDYYANGNMMINIGWGIIALGFVIQFTQAGYAIYCQLKNWKELRKEVYFVAKKLCLKKRKMKIRRVVRFVNQPVQG